MPFEKFEHRIPSAQTATDIFAGRWASDLSALAGVTNTGSAGLFLSDPRPLWAAEAFGRGTGRLDGMRVLELGPLEAGHSYQLEQLGAREVVAVDANVEAYLKCLVVKEVLGLKKCRFLLGDALQYLLETEERFDLIFCSGLLYELADPIALIKACCEVSNRCFVWTHVYDRARPIADMTPRKVEVDGFEATYFERPNPGQQDPAFWGGASNLCAWMTEADMLACFRRFGLDDVQMVETTPKHPNGPAMAFTASRGLSDRFVRLTAPPAGRKKPRSKNGHP